MSMEKRKMTDVKHCAIACFRHNLYLTTGLMLLCGCSGQSWSALHSSVIAEQYTKTAFLYDSYNFNQHFDNLHLEATQDNAL